MSEPPISSKYRSRPDQPVGDDERSDLSERLNDAYTRGELSEEEYRSRLDRLFGARTLGELLPVVTGLPPRQTYTAPAIVEQDAGGRPGELAEPAGAVRPAVLVTVSVAGLAMLAIVLLLILLL